MSDDRDFVGYGRDVPRVTWPNGARLAIILAVNYEAGAETSILHGDETSEGRLNDTPSPAIPGRRVPLVESVFEFGARRGIWRLFDLISNVGVKSCLFACGQAIERNPDVARAFVDAGHEVVGHGYRWISYHDVDEDTQRDHLRRTVRAIEEASGSRPVGWFSGTPTAHTRNLIVEEGGFLYDRDSLADELPYWDRAHPGHLIIPYSFETNDMVFGKSSGFVTGDDFYRYLREACDVLVDEGKSRPKLMSIGLHDRIVGRPARSSGLGRFLDYAAGRGDIWFATGREVAEHWRAHHPE